ncbi:MAG: efflux RND transporter periplasmic adaptor subunit [Blastocatellia bacterium]|nr:efflux RND transporter periplasmic adaptor subunit [Blastocatellia bacterium]
MKLKFLAGKRNLLVGIAVIAIGLIATYLYLNRSGNSEEYLLSKIDRGNIRNSVAATGTLQAVRTVPVGAQVSGIIQHLMVDFNDQVHTGQIVAKLDPVPLEQQLSQQKANLEQARANLANAEAKLLAAKADVDTQQAGVSSANANLAALKAQSDDAKSLLDRQQGLANSGLITDRDLEASRASYNAAKARYDQAVAQLEQARVSEKNSASAGLAQAEAMVKQAKAQVLQAEGSVKLAETNLGYATIYSPIDGVVVSRDSNEGQTVASNFSAPTLFTIATDLREMQVIAAIDQADIGVINQSNKVSFTVDAFPGQSFQGTINQIRLNATNVSNVVTYNVVIDFKNPDLKLKPGMTANLTFSIAERDNVLKIPNAALRFKPADISNEKIREMLRGASANNTPQANKNAEATATPTATPTTEAGQPKGPGRDKQAAVDKPGSKAQVDQPAAGANAPQNKMGEMQEGQGKKRMKDKDQQAAAGGEKPTADEGKRFAGFAPPTAIMTVGQWRVVWVLGGPDKTPQPRRIQIGITDGTSTEILKGDLQEGEEVIVMQNVSANSRSNRPQTPPGFGGGGGPGRIGGPGRGR